MPIARESGNEIEFQPAPLNTLIDSPVSAGSHYRTVDLGVDDGIAHYLHLAGDSDRAIEITPDDVTHYRNLVKEAGALFGSRHYRDYHFLLTLSDHIASFGLEHHESSDDRVGERSLVDDDAAQADGGSAAARIRAFMEWEVPAPGGPGYFRLQPADEGRPAVGV